MTAIITRTDFRLPTPDCLTPEDLRELFYLDQHDQKKVLALMEAEGFSFDVALDLLDYYMLHEDMDIRDLFGKLAKTSQTATGLDLYFSRKSIASYLMGETKFIQTSYGVIEGEA